MRLMISFAALFLSVLLLQLSSGGLGPLDALSGLTLGFTTGEIGLLGSAHFVGFFVGCWWAPRLMGDVGHSRAFAAFTATGAIGMLAHMMVVDPLAWAVMRLMSGLCVAGCYTIVEAWLQSKVTNDLRARTMGTYRVVDMSGALLAQLVIGVLEPAAYVSYNLLAMVCCAALLPLTVTKVKQPETPAAPRLRPMLAVARSPLAAAAVVVSAVSAASFRMVGALFGQEVGLTAGQTAWFLAIFVLGGAVAQFPVGWLADKFDRRWVLIWLSAGTIVVSGFTIVTQSGGTWVVLFNAFLFGMASFPIYSIASAHAHDFAESHERVELSAALMFFYAVGAIAAPYVSSLLIAGFGPYALFVMISAAHAVLVIFGLIRMSARPSPSARTSYVWAPRTSFVIGRLTGRARDDGEG